MPQDDDYGYGYGNGNGNGNGSGFAPMNLRSKFSSTRPI